MKMAMVKIKGTYPMKALVVLVMFGFAFISVAYP